MNDHVVNIQDNLIQFDNLLTALNYLIEEVETRKNQAVKEADLVALVKQEMNTKSFKDDIVENIRYNYGNGIYQEVAFLVMEKIDNDIEAFVNARVDERLAQLGVTPNEG